MASCHYFDQLFSYQTHTYAVPLLYCRDSKELRVMKQRLKQLEFQEKLKQKTDVAANQNLPAGCSNTPSGRQ